MFQLIIYHAFLKNLALFGVSRLFLSANFADLEEEWGPRITRINADFFCYFSVFSALICVGLPLVDEPIGIAKANQINTNLNKYLPFISVSFAFNLL